MVHHFAKRIENLKWATNLLVEQQLGNKYTQKRGVGQQIREERTLINPIKTGTWQTKESKLLPNTEPTKN
jgi:hypothetical protein